VDSGVLIAAARGTDEVFAKAMEVIDDPDRVFISSDFVRLELMPKPSYFNRVAEAEFYETFFDKARMVRTSSGLVSQALEEACSAGLGAVDALHVVAAKRGKADELVTNEKPTKPIFRIRNIRVSTIRPGN